MSGRAPKFQLVSKPPTAPVAPVMPTTLKGYSGK